MTLFAVRCPVLLLQILRCAQNDSELRLRMTVSWGQNDSGTDICFSRRSSSAAEMPVEGGDEFLRLFFREEVRPYGKLEHPFFQ